MRLVSALFLSALSLAIVSVPVLGHISKMLLRCAASPRPAAAARFAPRSLASPACSSRRMASQAPAPAKHVAAPAVHAPAAVPAKKNSFSDLTPLLERNPPSKVEIQDEIAKLRATAKSLGIENDDITNHPEVNRIFSNVQSRSVAGVDPVRDIRDHANAGVSIKVPLDFCLPHLLLVIF
jgi:hypothetical protein